MRERWDDGWYELPSGAAVEVVSGAPRWLSDHGRQQLDEGAMLREACERFEVPLHFSSSSRASRWRRRSLWRILGLATPEAFARLTFGPCDICGNEAGVVRVKGKNGADAATCRNCGADVEAGRVTIED